MIERELKFQVAEAFELPELDDILAGPDEPAEHTVVDTYYDTADFRLLRWDATLRNRQRQGWHVKLPRGVDRSALVRNEVHIEGPAGRIPADAADLVRPFARGAELDVVATISTRRISRTWSDDGGTLVELTDDAATGTTPDGSSVRFRQLEVELAEGADDAILDRFVDALVEAGARPDPAAVKVRTVLGRPDPDPADVVVPTLTEAPSARAVIRRAVARSVAQLITELPNATLGDEPEGVHQARVATRRLRSDLRTFRRLLDPDWADVLHDDLRELAHRLGAVRDTDVLLDLLRRTAHDAPRIDLDGCEPILELLRQQRRDHLDALRDHLRQDRASQLLDRLVAAAADPPTTDRARRPATDQLPGLVARRWRKLDDAVRALEDAPSPEELHQVRILTKRTRYAAEAVAPALATTTGKNKAKNKGKPKNKGKAKNKGNRTAGPSARRFARALARAQDDLGDRNDLRVAEQWLIDHADQVSSVAAFSAGRLAGALTGTGAAKSSWRDRYRTAARNRDWFRR